MKREHYSHAITDEHKKKKRKEAIIRQESRKQRTNKQQLQKLNIEGHTAKKERTKLENTK